MKEAIIQHIKLVQHKTNYKHNNAQTYQGMPIEKLTFFVIRRRCRRGSCSRRTSHAFLIVSDHCCNGFGYRHA